MAFLKAEYRILIIFVVIVACLLAFVANSQGDSKLVSISFLSGAFASALAGYLGMKVATKSNNRTTNAARTSLAKALNVAFVGGSVMGLSVVGLGVLGVTGLFIIYDYLEIFTETQKLIETITGFSLGASSIALFARVGGGIYTKAADVGADLVGKVEAGIPEDHPLIKGHFPNKPVFMGVLQWMGIEDSCFMLASYLFEREQKIGAYQVSLDGSIYNQHGHLVAELKQVTVQIYYAHAPYLNQAEIIATKKVIFKGMVFPNDSLTYVIDHLTFL